MIRICIFLTVCFFVFGCTTPSKTTSFYTLNEPEKPENVTYQVSNQKMLLIERISLADYLRQSGIVVKNTNNKVSLSSNHRWAEGLESSLSRVIRSQLEHKLSHFRVENLDMQWQEKIDLRMKIEVGNFELDNTENKAVLGGRFWLLGEHGKLLRSRQFLIRKPLDTNGFEHAVSKLEAALEDLAEQMVEEINSLNDER